MAGVKDGTPLSTAEDRACDDTVHIFKRGYGKRVMESVCGKSTSNVVNTAEGSTCAECLDIHWKQRKLEVAQLRRRLFKGSKPWERA